MQQVQPGKPEAQPKPPGISNFHEHDDTDSSLTPTGRRTTDPEKASSNHRHETTVATRKLLLKLDLSILPFAALLYLSSYLDRGNL